MAFQYRKHYTREEARALLPQLREWLKQLNHLRQWHAQCDKRTEKMLAGGNDIGGELVNNWVKMLCEVRGLLRKFEEREIQVKDIERGLVDFPAIVRGKEAFLCWEQDEDDIEFWHYLDTGFAGREKL